jgi:hypothetical protein
LEVESLEGLEVESQPAMIADRRTLSAQRSQFSRSRRPDRSKRCPRRSPLAHAPHPADFQNAGPQARPALGWPRAAVLVQVGGRSRARHRLRSHARRRRRVALRPPNPEMRSKVGGPKPACSRPDHAPAGSPPPAGPARSRPARSPTPPPPSSPPPLARSRARARSSARSRSRSARPTASTPPPRSTRTRPRPRPSRPRRRRSCRRRRPSPHPSPSR